MSRRKLFAKPAPEGWRPKVGDTVIVNRIAGTLAKMVSTGIVRKVLDDLVTVRLSYGRATKDYQFLIEDFRPLKGG